jgi:hypothetical protein
MRLHSITLRNIEGTSRVCARCSESMFKAILVASNGSALADRALAVAERLARESRLHLVLAHIIEVMRSRGSTIPINPSGEWLQKKIRLQVGRSQGLGCGRRPGGACDLRRASQTDCGYRTGVRG